MDKTKLVYVTYVRAPAERLWDALTQGEATHRYWSHHRNASDWRIGSEWRHEDYDDPSKVDVVGTVLDSDRPRRLVMSWSSPADAGDPARTSRVSFDVVEDRGVTRLTLTHDQLDPDTASWISGAWSFVLASLKTLLETGEPLPELFQRTPTGWQQLRFAN